MRMCSICSHQNATEINQKLISGTPRLVVAKEYALSPPAMHRHWQDHVPHDDLYEVEKAMKSWKEILYKEQKKEKPDRMVIKDCDLRLAALRNEKRALEAVAKEETPRKIEPGDLSSVELTIEGIDEVIRYQIRQPNMRGPLERLWGKLYLLPSYQREAVCARIIAMLPGLMKAPQEEGFYRVPLTRTSLREN